MDLGVSENWGMPQANVMKSWVNMMLNHGIFHTIYYIYHTWLVASYFFDLSILFGMMMPTQQYYTSLGPTSRDRVGLSSDAGAREDGKIVAASEMTGTRLFDVNVEQLQAGPDRGRSGPRMGLGDLRRPWKSDEIWRVTVQKQKELK